MTPQARADRPARTRAATRGPAGPDPAATRLAGLRVLLPLLLPAVLACLLGAPGTGARETAAGPEIVVETGRVLLPCVDVPALGAGGVALSPLLGGYAIKITVTPADADRGWVLWMEAAAPRFRASDGDKPCRDLRWKHDDESPSAYRPVREDGVPVFECEGGSAELHVDLMAAVDWHTAPGVYRLGLAFRLQPLE